MHLLIINYYNIIIMRFSNNFNISCRKWPKEEIPAGKCRESTFEWKSPWKEKIIVDNRVLLWYSIKAVAERHGGRTEKIWKERKKFLTNGFEFDILNKLSRKRRRSEKFEFRKKHFKNFEKKFWKKFLTNKNESDIMNKLRTRG